LNEESGKTRHEEEGKGKRAFLGFSESLKGPHNRKRD